MAAQLRILQLQLDLVHLQLMHKTLQIRIGSRAGSWRLMPKDCLSLLTQGLCKRAHLEGLKHHLVILDIYPLSPLDVGRVP
jgi:hypothetical protein